MTAEQQATPAQSQNAIMAAAGRFKDMVGNLLKEVGWTGFYCSSKADIFVQAAKQSLSEGLRLSFVRY